MMPSRCIDAAEALECMRLAGCCGPVDLLAVAAAGSGARDTETLHRIDPELVKQEVTSVGFVFVAGSDVLHNPEDKHDAKVFELKGRSDKFLFKFRKPGK